MSTSLTLGQVQSFEYVIGIGGSDYWSSIGASSSQLILSGGGAANGYAPLDRSVADPKNNKLIFAYIEATEASSYAEPDLFSNGSPNASWIGKPVPGYSDLYTVQYWNPQWLTEIKNQISKIAAAGYDGVFLDSLSDDQSFWSPGNSLGNPGSGTATQDLATLIGQISAYVKSLHLSHPFYLIGNNPTSIALQNPSALSNLDGIFNENIYWIQPPSNGLTSVYNGTGTAASFQNNIYPIYKNTGIPVFGNDYPLPLNDYNTVFKSFAYYSNLGIVSSVQRAYQTSQIFTTGPLIETAVAANPVVSGASNLVNFLSGGAVTAATLTGGNQGDYFIGGPGTNKITGGDGSDTIYAHPANAALKGLISLSFYDGGMNITQAPMVQVSINGQTVVQPTSITATQPGNPQVISLSAPNNTPISSLQITVTNVQPYVDSSHFANIFLEGITYNGATIPLSAASWTNNVSVAGLFNGNDRALFPASAFQSPSPFPTNTSDVIDGGGGVNTVVYRDPHANYTIATQADGSLLVSSAATAEGPDTLRNIQHFLFTDGMIARETAAAFAPELDTLQGLAAQNQLLSVTLTDPGIPVVRVAAAQAASDLGALKAISGYFSLIEQAPTTSASIVGPAQALGNTVAFSGNAANYTITPKGDGSSFTITGNGASDSLSNVQALQFADRTLIVAAAPGSGTVTTGNVTELYGAVFGRLPDVPGLAYYQQELAANPSLSLTALAQNFLQSSEYTSNSAHLYAVGVAGDTQFITDLYQNLLHRSPAAGDAAWYEANVIAPIVGTAPAGSAAYNAALLAAHATVVTDFSASPEFLSDVQITAAHPADANHWLVLI